jgi:hypothetical protein
MSISHVTLPPALAGLVHNSLQPDKPQPPPQPATPVAATDPTTITGITTQPGPDGSVTTTTTYANGNHSTSSLPTANQKATSPLNPANSGQLATLLTAQEHSTPPNVPFGQSSYATLR